MPPTTRGATAKAKAEDEASKPAESSKVTKPSKAAKAVKAAEASKAAESKELSKSTRKCRRCGHSKPPKDCGKELPQCSQCTLAGVKCSYELYPSQLLQKNKITGAESKKQGIEAVGATKESDEESEKGSESDSEVEDKGGKKGAQDEKKSAQLINSETPKSTRKCIHCTKKAAANGDRLSCSKDLPECLQCQEAHVDCSYEPYPSQMSKKNQKASAASEKEKVGTVVRSGSAQEKKEVEAVVPAIKNVLKKGIKEKGQEQDEDSGEVKIIDSRRVEWTRKDFTRGFFYYVEKSWKENDKHKKQREWKKLGDLKAYALEAAEFHERYPSKLRPTLDELKEANLEKNQNE